MRDRKRMGYVGWADIAAWSAAILVASAFAWILADIVWTGFRHISLAFLTEAPTNAGREGGIGTILVATVWIVGVCLLAALPVGMATGILLAEFADNNNWFPRGIRRSLDVLAGVPSIVFGLFGNALFCKMLGLGFSILSGGLTLACMVLPILIRSVEEGCRSVPQSHRLAAAALGFSRTSTLFRVVLPMAVPGVAVGLVLAIGRALAETAALIFTSGYVDRMPESALDSGRALSVHIYDLSMNVPGGNAHAAATACMLIMLLLVINSSATWAAKRLLHAEPMLW